MISIMSQVFKRILDLLLACGGVVIFLPLWLLLSLLIRIRSGGPVYYIQERVGKDGKPFKIIKFRTMSRNKQVETAVSRLLRRTAMDELPQLINIVSGKMSFVGPRPLIREEMEQTRGRDSLKERLKIRPGLTGVAQVLLNKNASLEEKFLYDIWYVRRQSLLIDAELILISFLITFFGRWELDNNKLFILSRLRRRVVSSSYSFK